VLRNSLYAEYQVREAVQAVATGTLVHNRGEGRVAYVSREDCAAAAAAVLAGPGHEGAVYDVTGPAALGARDPAALYSELGGREVKNVALDDEAFVARLLGDEADTEHMRYGAQLVASFGRSVRDGFMGSCTDTVPRLTGRAATTLRQILEAHGHLAGALSS